MNAGGLRQINDEHASSAHHVAKNHVIKPLNQRRTHTAFGSALCAIHYMRLIVGKHLRKRVD